MNALAYDIDPLKGLVSIMAEAVTEKDNKKLTQIWGQYDKKRLVLVKGMYIPEGYALLL